MNTTDKTYEIQDYAYKTLVTLENLIRLIEDMGLIVEGQKPTAEPRTTFADMYNMQTTMVDILAKIYNIDPDNAAISEEFTRILMGSLEEHHNYNTMPNEIHNEIITLISGK